MLREIVDRDYVGVIEFGDNMGFAFESSEEIGIALERGMEHFDRDVAIEHGMVGLEDSCHSALPKLLDNSIGTDIFTRCKVHILAGAPKTRRNLRPVYRRLRLGHIGNQYCLRFKDWGNLPIIWGKPE